MSFFLISTTTSELLYFSEKYKMRELYCAVATLTAFFAIGAGARETRPNEFTSQRYDSGAVHEELMAKKMVNCPI